jgi:hypothetical protein
LGALDRNAHDFLQRRFACHEPAQSVVAQVIEALGALVVELLVRVCTAGDKSAQTVVHRNNLVATETA